MTTKPRGTPVWPAAGPAVGRDGKPLVFVEARGSEVIDPATGRVLREAVDGRTNINVDRLEWLLAHKRIEPHHHAAGRRFQADWEGSERISYGGLSNVRGGAGIADVAAGRIEAIKRRNDARERLGPLTFRFVEMVCLENMSVEKAATCLRLHPKVGMGLFIGGLDTLARFYGLA